MLNPDAWHRKQVWQLLWQGPGAVSTFWSMPLALVGAALSFWLSSLDLHGQAYLCP